MNFLKKSTGEIKYTKVLHYKVKLIKLQPSADFRNNHN